MPDRPIVTQKKIRELGLHSPYNPDLDHRIIIIYFNLFRTPPDAVNFVSMKERKNHLSRFFVQKPLRIYSISIMILSGEWQKIIDDNGAYIAL